jgi:hypothetical protein
MRNNPALDAVQRATLRPSGQAALAHPRQRWNLHDLSCSHGNEGCVSRESTQTCREERKVLLKRL